LFSVSVGERQTGSNSYATTKIADIVVQQAINMHIPLEPMWLYSADDSLAPIKELVALAVKRKPNTVPKFEFPKISAVIGAMMVKAPPSAILRTFSHI